MNSMQVKMNDLSVSSIERVREEDQREDQEEPEESGVKLNDLPELPFELILSYVPLGDRIKSKAVSRRWYNVISSFRPTSLFYSRLPIGLIDQKNRWVSGTFIQNFVCSTRTIQSFFQTFDPSILSNLKHLRLCDFSLNKNELPDFARALNSFGQLEELDIIRSRSGSLGGQDLNLNLPRLNSIHLEEVYGIGYLTLDAPKLLKVKIRKYHPALRLKLVRGESVETLIVDYCHYTEVENLKNLKYLYAGDARICQSFQFGLKQLKEIHLYGLYSTLEMFELKQKFGRVDLSIFFRGCLVNSPVDRAIDSFDKKEFYGFAIEHPWRLAEEIPLLEEFGYSGFDRVPRGSEIKFFQRFTDLKCIRGIKPIRDVQRFLNLLKNLNNIAELKFPCNQPQHLFNGLPEHCAGLQSLTFCSNRSDLHFLYELQNLVSLGIFFPIKIGFIRRAFERLPFLLRLELEYRKKMVVIKVEPSKQFKVCMDGYYYCVPDPTAVIESLVHRIRRARG